MVEWVDVGVSVCLCARVKFRIILLSCFSVKLGMQHLLKNKKKKKIFLSF